MSTLQSALRYYRHSRKLADYWNRSLPGTAFKVVLSRMLHHRGAAEFELYRFANRRLRDWTTFLDDRELLAMQLESAPERFRFLEENKLAFATRCAQAHLPTPAIDHIIASRNSTHFDFGEYAVAHSPHETTAYFQTREPHEGFAKPLGAGEGYGVFNFTWHGGFVSTSERWYTPAEFHDCCATSLFAGAGYLLQPRIRTHDTLAALMPLPALGTLRICTFLLRNGDVAMPLVNLKIPARGAESDNMRFGSLAVPVDVNTGRLGMALGKAHEFSVVDMHEKHPDTGVRFDEFVLPQWSSVRALVQRAAHAFRELPALGWDVAITNDGPVLIETNWKFGAPDQPYAHGFRAQFRDFFEQLSQPKLLDVALRL